MFVLTKLLSNLAQLAHSKILHGACAPFAIALIGIAITASPPQSRDQTIPEAWIGTWEVSVDYRDRQTGALVATDVTTDEICPGDPIIPPQLAQYPQNALAPKHRVIEGRRASSKNSFFTAASCHS